MSLRNHIYEHFFERPIHVIDDDDAINVNIGIDIDVLGEAAWRKIATVSLRRAGRPMVVRGVRYTRDLVDGRIVKRCGEIVADVKRPWWLGGKTQRILVGADVTFHDGRLEEIIMTRGVGAILDYCGIAAKGVA